MSTLLILLVLVVLLGGGGWSYSRYPGSGPYLGGGIGLVILLVVLWLVFSGGRL